MKGRGGNMKDKITGIDNEFQFVTKFNNKYVYELDPLARDFIESIFENICDNDLIKCFRNRYPQKSDIIIMINGNLKGVSIKIGSRNSVHLESINSFCEFLAKIKINKKIIDKYLYYHFADGTIDGTGKDRISKDLYYENHMDDIHLINCVFNKANVVSQVIDRFVLYGKNSKYPIAAIICGSVNDFMWLTRDEIIDAISNTKVYNSTGVHFGPLFCQPQNRCLNRNPKYENTRYNVQVKWYSLFDDIIKYRNNLAMAKSKDNIS